MCQKSVSSPLCDTPKKEKVQKNPIPESPSQNLSQLLDESCDDLKSDNNRLGFESKKLCQTSRIILKNFWMSIGLITTILELYITQLHEHSQERLLYQFEFIVHQSFVLFIIGETIRKARLKAIDYTQKKRSEEKRENSLITMRMKDPLKERDDKFTILLFFGFLLVGALFLPLFRLEGNEEITNNNIFKILASVKSNFYSNNGERYTHSIIEIFYVLFTSKMRSMLMIHFRAKKKALALWVSRRTAAQVLKNPLRLHFRIQQLFTVIRLAKYLPQLIGTGNKLNGHVQDFLKKRKERLRKQRAEIAWARLMESVSQKQKLDRAVRRIQYNFRKRRERKSIRVVSHIKSRPRRATEVFQRIEARMKKRAEESRKRLNLAKKVDQERFKRRKVTHTDIKRIKKHEKEMRDTQRQLLLSPNTSFSVNWKIVAISCVFLELFHIAVSPYVSGKMKKLPLHTLFEMVIPIPKVCQISKKESSRKLVPILGIFNPVSSTSFAMNSSLVYCSTILETRLSMIHVLSNYLELIMYVVSFLDVFITFFTGEIKHKCGLVIRPKSFLVRWVFPGVGLQLIVNPSMHHVGSVLKRFVSFCFKVGPIKSLQMFSVMQPHIIMAVQFCINAMYDFIERQNANAMKHKN